MSRVKQGIWILASQQRLWVTNLYDKIYRLYIYLNIYIQKLFLILNFAEVIKLRMLVFYAKTCAGEAHCSIESINRSQRWALLSFLLLIIQWTTNRYCKFGHCAPVWHLTLDESDSSQSHLVSVSSCSSLVCVLSIPEQNPAESLVATSSDHHRIEKQAVFRMDFSYDILTNPSESIRLLTIVPDLDEATVRCIISQYKFSVAHSHQQCPAYCAISYTWSPLGPRQSKELNGQHLLIG